MDSKFVVSSVIRTILFMYVSHNLVRYTDNQFIFGVESRRKEIGMSLESYDSGNFT